MYAIGYKGLHQPEIFRYDRPETPEPVETTAPVRVLDEEPDLPAAGVSSVAERSDPAASPLSRADRTEARYQRSGLGEFETRRLKAALLTLMADERPYRDPELTLPALAERLKSTPHKLSEVLNRELSQTFYDFVNGYRVEDVRGRLADPDTKRLNILALGLDAGFASKSTFNQAFKKLTGQTPSSYRKALEAREARVG